MRIADIAGAVGSVAVGGSLSGTGRRMGSLLRIRIIIHCLRWKKCLK